jgi:hypothetical protein
MDARGVERLLDKTYGMADTAVAAGAKTIEGIARDARLSDVVKTKLIPLYREESLRRALNYAGLGLAVCRTVEQELDNDAARARLEFYRRGLAAIYTQTQDALREFADSRALEPP